MTTVTTTATKLPDGRAGLLRSQAVATNPPGDLELSPIGAEARPVAEWLTMFHLGLVVLDPYTHESSWILRTASRILEGLRGADVRVSFVVTADESDAKAFMGPLVTQFLVFTDADRTVTKALGLHELPAFVFVRVDGTVPIAAEGWNPAQWRAVAETIADTTAWNAPQIPMSGDPQAFPGSPALS